MYPCNRARTAGFTLIELVIVMVIIGLGLSVIIPFTVQQVDSANARNEREKIIILVKNTRNMALFRSAEMRLTFFGRQVSVAGVAENKQLNLAYLSFLTEAEIVVGQTGAYQAAEIAATINGKNWTLKVFHDKAEWAYAD